MEEAAREATRWAREATITLEEETAEAACARAGGGEENQMVKGPCTMHDAADGERTPWKRARQKDAAEAEVE
jgi:hypothetical protein